MCNETEKRDEIQITDKMMETGGRILADASSYYLDEWIGGLIAKDMFLAMLAAAKD
jgi:hypothetical protein